MSAGLVSGFFGGFIDNFLMRIGDITLSIPTILVAILVSTIVRQMLPPDLREAGAAAVLILAIALSAWVQYARTVRAQAIVEFAERIMCRPQGLSVFRRTASWQSTSCPTR